MLTVRGRVYFIKSPFLITIALAYITTNFQPGGKMAEADKRSSVAFEELLVSGLAQTDALAKLLIEKGIIFGYATRLPVQNP